MFSVAEYQRSLIPLRVSTEFKISFFPIFEIHAHITKFTYLIAVTVVFDIRTDAVPSYIFLLSSPLRVQEWSHTLRIQAAALHQVDNSEAIGHSSFHVSYSEVEPLCVLSCVHVCAQGELIFIDTPE